jgi:proline racemase
LNINRVLWCIDTHTECDPARLVVGGIPPLPQMPMRERKNYFMENYDDIRRMIMHEPRGHRDMFGVVVTDSIIEACDFGVLFIDTDGYLDFCGHGVMAATNVMLQLFGLKPKDANGTVNIETPAGVVKAKPVQEESLVISVEGVPSFLVETGVVVKTSLGLVPVDISYGGNFFAFVNSDDIGISVNEANIPRLTSIALEIKERLNEKEWKHPEMPDAGRVDLVEILDAPTDPTANDLNILVFGEGQVGRDPCASGTCAKIALEIAKGNLRIGQDYGCQVILGTVYRGRALKECKVGSFPAVIPEIRGRSFVTGIHNFLLYKNDPLPQGWLIR